MVTRPTKLAAQSSIKRRSTRFRASVEALDARQLLAAGVTGQVVKLDAIVEESVSFTNIDFTGLPLDGIYSVPLVTLSSTAGPLLASGVTATVDYGDGTPVAAAEAVAITRSPGQLVIDGPDHTYTTPGTYKITIAVVEPGDTSPTIFVNPITVNPPPISITGQLSGGTSSFTGPFGDTMSTNATRPRFAGFTQPGATIVLTATNLANPSLNLVVGTGTANASGNWDITLVPFVDGRYNIAALATGQFGATAGAFLAGPFDNFLQVDTAGPKVVSFQITNARTGSFAIGFDDPYGMNLYPLTQPSTYSLTRTSPATRKGQTFTVTNLQSSVQPDTLSSYTFAPVVVTGTLTTGKTPITQNGTYTLTLPSTDFNSLSGAPLDGEYTGHFPSGNGQGGGNFRVRFTIRNGKASGPIAIK